MGASVTNIRRKILWFLYNSSITRLFCAFACGIALVLLLDIGCLQNKYGDNFNIFPKNIDSKEFSAPVVQQHKSRKYAQAYERPRYHPRRKIGYLRHHGLPNNGENIVRILYKLAYCTDLTVVLPNDTSVFSMGYPNNFQANLTEDLYGNTEGFDVIAVHARWDLEEYSKLLVDEAKYITMLRNPVDAFLEMYEENPEVFTRFYGGDINEIISKMKLGIMPRKDRLGNIIGRNQFAWNFGMNDVDFENMEKVDQLIDHIDKTFHLVMIYERYNESVALLQKVLNVSTRLIAINNGPVMSLSDRVSVDADGKKAIESFLSTDIKIYTRFKRKFEELIKEVGDKEIRRIMEDQEKQNELNYKTCYDPNNIYHATNVTAETGIEMSWAVPFKDVSYCRVHGLTEQSLHQDLIYIQMNKDFRNIYRDPSVIFSHFHDEGL